MNASKQLRGPVNLKVALEQPNRELPLTHARHSTQPPRPAACPAEPTSSLATSCTQYRGPSNPTGLKTSAESRGRGAFCTVPNYQPSCDCDDLRPFTDCLMGQGH
jgi:hypothetical protein